MECILVFLDADDLWETASVRKQIQAFQKEENIALVFGNSQIIDATLKPLSAPSFILILGAMLGKKEIFDEIGFFDETLKSGEDFDWFMRILEKDYPYSIIPDIVLKHRRHEANMTNDVATQRLFLLKVIKRSLDRRRQKNQGNVPSLSSININN